MELIQKGLERAKLEIFLIKSREATGIYQIRGVKSDKSSEEIRLENQLQLGGKEIIEGLKGRGYRYVNVYGNVSETVEGIDDGEEYKVMVGDGVKLEFSIRQKIGK